MYRQQDEILIGLDIGTSGVKALAFTTAGQCLAQGRAAISTVYPTPGVAEQRPAEWWQASLTALYRLTEQLGRAARGVVGIGLTGQCPTFTCLRPAGKVTGPGLIYQDNRATTQADFLARHLGADAIHQRTGQAVSPFYILPKLLWLNEQQSNWLKAGSVVVQPRDLVGWYLTGRLATDPTHAACTLAYDLSANSWTLDWLSELGLAALSWPEIMPSCSVLGNLTAEAAVATGLPEKTPVIIGAADSICAAYGASATTVDALCEVTGTSTCLHLAVSRPISSHAVNIYPHIEPGIWFAEVGLNTTGCALAWLSALLKSTPEELLSAAETVEPGAAGLLFLPHLAGGERDEPGRCGAFIGLQLGHTTAHMTRALLEGIAYALRQRVTLLEAAGCNISHVISCGGASRSQLWAQIKADVLGKPVKLVEPFDTTAWGAALIAAQTLDIPVTSSPLMHTTFQPGDSRYTPYYERFCHLENLLIVNKDKIGN
ncbi:xylulokinase [Ktedonosporobacter rubrisoli]|nr:FGGY family carbohydrate kinase [Ktedonosporobacter rubrisoli]